MEPAEPGRSYQDEHIEFLSLRCSLRNLGREGSRVRLSSPIGFLLWRSDNSQESRHHLQSLRVRRDLQGKWLAGLLDSFELIIAGALQQPKEVRSGRAGGENTRAEVCRYCYTVRDGADVEPESHSTLTGTSPFLLRRARPRTSSGSTCSRRGAPRWADFLEDVCCILLHIYICIYNI